ncbi:MAG: tyrosine-type recombinase/integrase [Acidimicrobiales bacterium]
MKRSGPTSRPSAPSEDTAPSPLCVRREDRHHPAGASHRPHRPPRRPPSGFAKSIGPHTLRHAFITAALDAGVPLRDVQEVASHADPRTTMRYDRARVSLDRHATSIASTTSRDQATLTLAF